MPDKTPEHLAVEAAAYRRAQEASLNHENGRAVRALKKPKTFGARLAEEERR